MRARLIRSSILAIFLVSCEGAQLQEGQLNRAPGSGASGDAEDISHPTVNRGSSDNLQSAGDSDQTPVSALPSSSAAAPNPSIPKANPLVNVEIPESAYIPVSVGGASLTCIAPLGDKLKTSCYTLNPSSKAGAYIPKKAYFIVFPTLNWIEVPFAKIAAPTIGAVPEATYYSIDLPYSVKNKSFAVALSDAINDAVLDWVPSAADPLPVSVADGSFEAIQFNDRYATQFLTPDLQKSWKAKSKNPDCMGIFELSNSRLDPKVSTQFGSNWTELDSACIVNGIGPGTLGGSIFGGDNVTIYQDLKLQLDHLYEISFMFRHRENKPNLQRMTARFGGETIMTQTVTNNEWQVFKFTRKAKAATVRLEMEELGDGSDGEGTLIDNVIVTDTGKGPVGAP